MCPRLCLITVIGVTLTFEGVEFNSVVYHSRQVFDLDVPPWTRQVNFLISLVRYNLKRQTQGLTLDNITISYVRVKVPHISFGRCVVTAYACYVIFQPFPAELSLHWRHNERDGVLIFPASRLFAQLFV